MTQTHASSPEIPCVSCVIGLFGLLMDRTKHHMGSRYDHAVLTAWVHIGIPTERVGQARPPRLRSQKEGGQTRPASRSRWTEFAVFGRKFCSAVIPRASRFQMPAVTSESTRHPSGARTDVSSPSQPRAKHSFELAGVVGQHACITGSRSKHSLLITVELPLLISYRSGVDTQVFN